MKKTCLVLGGSGFIGSHLVDSLVEKGFNVRVYAKSNMHKKNLSLSRDRITIINGDFTNIKELDKAIMGCDYVFHFISTSTPASRELVNSEKEVSLNLSPTINLLKLCIKHKVKKIIFPSSGGTIYGNSKSKFKKETDNLYPISLYGVDKLAIEKLLFYFWEKYKLDYCIYRISNAYGERQSFDGNQGIIPIAIKKAINKEKIDVFGNTTRDYIYVKDVADFISDNFDKKHLYKEYNLGSGKGVTLKRLLTIIEKQIKIKIKSNRLPIRDFEVRKIVLNINRIEKEFNFNARTSLEEGITKTYNYIKSSI